jgi:hypothetical protein
MLRIGVIRWKGHCAKHPRYHPETDGLGGIKGGCRRCEMLLDIFNQHRSLIRLVREFGTRPEPPPKGNDDVDPNQMNLFKP